MYPCFSRGRFFNHAQEKRKHILLPSLRMMIACQLATKRAQKAEIESLLNRVQPLERSHDLAITWIGHSTFLIQIDGYNIITDPIFGNLPLFKRITSPGISLEALPPIDFVLISHNHRDHMDAPTILALKKKNPQVLFLVPQGDGAWFTKREAQSTECMWWDTFRFDSLKLSFLPAFHWSQRGLFDFNKSLWGSWMIECSGSTIYFAGDTAYANHFKAIGREFPKVDIALMPIGPCEPHILMAHAHVNAEEAGQAFLDLDAQYFIPMHWGTYYFGIDTFNLPYNRLVSWWTGQKLENKKLLLPKIGQRLNPLKISVMPTVEPTLTIESAL